MSQYYYIVLWVSGGLAALSVLLLPGWILGIPGNPRDPHTSGKAWTIGFFTLRAYPIAWLCLLISWLIARKLVGPEHLPVLQLCTGAGALILLVVAILLMSYAFRNLF